jgi:(E)-4-hydroxy-3-methylbut-2-enyl-diphosphate synthase
MSRVVPIHLYITKKDLENRKFLSDIKSVCEEGVSALWLETKNRADAGLINELASTFQASVIPIVKDPSLIGEVIESVAKGIGIIPAFRKELLAYSDVLAQKRLDVYLTAGEDESFYLKYELASEQRGKKLLFLINEIADTVKELKNAGIHNTFVHIQHSDPVIHFNMSRYLKKYCGTRHVISTVPCRDKQKSVVLNSLCLGSLFYEKIGDVILLKVPEGSAYSCDNLKGAVEIVKKILGSFRLFPVGYSIISCPTCGRCRMELLNMTEEIDRRLKELEKRYNEEGKRLEDTGGIIIAVMGCNVNGPGEARNADIGIAGRKDKTGIIFKNGKPFKTLPENRLVDELILHTKNLIDERLSARLC